MDTLRGPSSVGLQHMASRAKEMRALNLPAAEPSTAESGKKTTQPGNSLPPTAATEQPAHDTSIQRAIERLQQNVEKNPQAQGLQQALEKLQARLTEPPVIDTTA